MSPGSLCNAGPARKGSSEPRKLVTILASSFFSEFFFSLSHFLSSWSLITFWEDHFKVANSKFGIFWRLSTQEGELSSWLFGMANLLWDTEGLCLHLAEDFVFGLTLLYCTPEGTHKRTHTYCGPLDKWHFTTKGRAPVLLVWKPSIVFLLRGA